MGILGKRRIMSECRTVGVLHELVGFPPPAPEDAFPLCDGGCDRTENEGSMDARNHTDDAYFQWELRRYVLLQATLVASVTYAACLNPPGGFWPGRGHGRKQTGDPIFHKGRTVFFYFNGAAILPCLFVLINIWTRTQHRRNRMILYILGLGLVGSYAVWGSRNVGTSAYAIAVAGALLNARRRGVLRAPPADEASIDERNKAPPPPPAEEAGYLVQERYMVLMFIATMAVTTSYQYGLTPPGGYGLNDNDAVTGDPLLNPHSRRYMVFFYFNATSFMLSTVVIILLLVYVMKNRALTGRRQPSRLTPAEMKDMPREYVGGWYQPDTSSLRLTIMLETLMTRRTLYTSSSEMPTELSIQVFRKRINWLQARPLSKFEQLKRYVEIRMKCLRTGKTSSILHFLDSVNLLLHSDGSGRQHQNILTDECNGKPRSNNAATNSSDETTRAPMAQKLITNDEIQNNSDPDSCVVERDVAVEAKEPATWYVATGAACHATGDSDLITDMVVERENDDGLCVHAADGTPMPVRGRGNVVTDTVVLPDVYYVPGLRTNLVSVGQLAGLDYSVGFSRGACVFNSAAGRVVGRAHAGKDGLYKVDFLVIPLDIR